MNRAVEIWEFRSFNINNEVFVDDIVILEDGSSNNLWSVKAIFQGFEMIFGLRVIFYKSNIYGINMSDRGMTTTSSFLSCGEDQIPFKILGVKLGDNP